MNVGGRYIHVFEFQRGRTVLDHDFEVVRTDRSIPQVLSSVVTDTDEVAFALHVPEGTGAAHQRLVLDMMGRTVSFGGADPVRRGPQMQRFVVAGDEETFWAARQQANRIVRWDLEPSPAVVRVFDRTVEEFERDNPAEQSWPRSLNVGCHARRERALDRVADPRRAVDGANQPRRTDPRGPLADGARRLAGPGGSINGANHRALPGR